MPWEAEDWEGGEEEEAITWGVVMTEDIRVCRGQSLDI